MVSLQKPPAGYSGETTQIRMRAIQYGDEGMVVSEAIGGQATPASYTLKPIKCLKKKGRFTL
jgi:hypothetical protein